MKHLTIPSVKKEAEALELAQFPVEDTVKQLLWKTLCQFLTKLDVPLYDPTVRLLDSTQGK